jgi:anti-sigma factor RsiW
MAWTCQNTEDRLLDALEGTLPPAEQVEWNAHVAACSRCSGLAAGVRGAVASLRQLEPVEPPPWLLTRIIQQTSGPRPQRRRLSWFDFLFHPRFALGVAAVFITLTILVHTFVGVPGSAGTLSPIQAFRQFDRRAHLVYARGVKFFSDLRVVYEIQSRFQPQNTTAPEPSSDKKSTDQLDQLLYNRLETRLRAPAVVTGDDSPSVRRVPWKIFYPDRGRFA